MLLTHVGSVGGDGRVFLDLLIVGEGGGGEGGDAVIRPGSEMKLLDFASLVRQGVFYLEKGREGGKSSSEEEKKKLT